MREKLTPWIPAIFCGVLSFITVAADLLGRLLTQTSQVGLSTFLCFLPMCFYFVGVQLQSLQSENRELKLQLVKISDQQSIHVKSIG